MKKLTIFTLLLVVTIIFAADYEMYWNRSVGYDIV